MPCFNSLYMFAPLVLFSLCLRGYKQQSAASIESRDQSEYEQKGERKRNEKGAEKER